MNDPFWRLPVVSSFTVTSTDITDGQALPSAQMSAIVVQAIGIGNVGDLQVQADSTPAWLGFMINMSGHLLGRAVITPWAEVPAA